MNRIYRIVLASALLLPLLAPSALAAPDRPDRFGFGEHRQIEPGQPHRPRPVTELNWDSYPADLQAMKRQLDDIRDKQKGLFELMKRQHEQLHDARKQLTPSRRETVKKSAIEIVGRMKATHSSIHALRQQKHETWSSFRKHADAKQWVDAKADMKRILDQKRQIVAKQQEIVTQQQQLLSLMVSEGKAGKPANQSPAPAPAPSSAAN